MWSQEPELAHMLRNLGECCDNQMVEQMLDFVDEDKDRSVHPASRQHRIHSMRTKIH